MRVIVRFLAVIGAIALVVTVVAGVALYRVSRPSAPSEAGTSRPQATAGSPQGGAGELRSIRGTIGGVSRASGFTTLTGVDATGVVPFAVVAAQAGPGVAITHDGQGRARITTPVTAFGRTIDVRAVGQVRAEGRDIVVDPVSVDTQLPGPLASAVDALARQAVTVRRPIQDMPTGLNVAGIEVADDGFHVHVVGDQVRAG